MINSSKNTEKEEFYSLLAYIDDVLISIGVYLECSQEGTLFKYGFPQKFINRIGAIMKDVNFY